MFATPETIDDLLELQQCMLARTQAQRVELDGRGGAFLKIGVENAELQPRQRVEVVQQLRQACVFEVKHTAAILLKRVVNL